MMSPEQEPTSDQPEKRELTPEQQEQALALNKEIAELGKRVEAGETNLAPELAEKITALAEIVVPPEQREREEPIPELAQIISENQQVYDWLGLGIDLKQEAEQNKIILPSPEQRESAERAGYTKAIIVPGQIPREELVEKVKSKYVQQFNSEGLKFWDQATADLNNTEVATNPDRPNQLYLIYIKPELEVKEAEPETMGKTFSECLELLNQRNQEDPQLNLKGPTLTEDLMAEALTFKIQGEHLEAAGWRWVLGEVVKENGQPVRCFDTFWNPDTSQLLVGSDSVSDRDSDWGARFAAVPKS